MSEIICVTNRRLCPEPLSQLERIAAAHPDSIILREKDLSESEYYALAEKVIDICERAGTVLTLHYYYKAAAKLGIRRIHLPLHILGEMSEEEKRCFDVIGVSCHSIGQARQAERSGASYITAGHVFETDCKAGLPGRGLGFLCEVKSCVSLPVYAIGGINESNAGRVISEGADGICIMSGFMRSDDPSGLVKRLRGSM